MKNLQISGDPGQEFYGVKVSHVVEAIKDLPHDFHTVADLMARYDRAVGVSSPDRHVYVEVILDALTAIPDEQDGAKGWWVNARILAEMWPKLPWNPPRDRVEGPWATLEELGWGA